MQHALPGTLPLRSEGAPMGDAELIVNMVQHNVDAAYANGRDAGLEAAARIVDDLGDDPRVGYAAAIRDAKADTDG